MSHSFYIRDVGDADLRATLNALPFDNLAVDAGQDGGSAWPSPAHIFQDGVSVRCVETNLDNGTLQVRIMAASSLDDFKLAMAIVEHVAQSSGKLVEPEDNEPLTLDQLREQYGEQWQRDTARSYLQSMISMHKRHEDAVGSIWGTRREFKMGPRLFGELLQEPATFAKNFFAKVRRLNYLEQEDIFIANLQAMANEKIGKQAVFAVVTENVDTAIDTRARFICLQSDSLTGNDSKPPIITFAEFESALGDGLTWLGDGMVIVPALSGERWSALIRSAGAQTVDVFSEDSLLEEIEAPSTPDNGTDSGISAEQWDLIAYAPVGVFLLVAGADGNVDKKEIGAFQKGLVGGVLGASNSEIMQQALLHVSKDLDDRLDVLTRQSGEAIAKMLFTAQQYVRAGAGPEAAQLFSNALCSLGEQVANASGGGFLGLGSKIGKEEKAILSQIRHILSEPS
jgi:hypothetical protein